MGVLGGALIALQYEQGKDDLKEGLALVVSKRRWGHENEIVFKSY